MLTGGKKSSLKCPRSEFSQVEVSLCIIMKYVGLNFGGLVRRVGRSLRGSPIIFQTILNLSGSAPITGLTLRWTGLYFFFAEIYIGIGF